MIGLIKNETKRIFKSRKNRIFLIVLILSILLVNIYYREKYKNFMEELEKETTISNDSAQVRIRKALVELSRFEKEEIDEELLVKEYGSIEKAEKARELLEIEIQRNKQEATYSQIPLILLQLQH